MSELVVVEISSVAERHWSLHVACRALCMGSYGCDVVSQGELQVISSVHQSCMAMVLAMSCLRGTV